jgi:hypothetical protein
MLMPMEQLTYVMLDEPLILPREVEHVADEVLACASEADYGDLRRRDAMGQRVTAMCEQLSRNGAVPASIAVALKKGLCSLLDDE